MIARQAEAERERRAKVINAEGELQAADKLRQAARLLSEQPASLQLRFLQTATEIAAENNSTTLFPIPMDLFRPFMRKAAASLIDLEGLEEEEAGRDEDSAETRELPAPAVGLPETRAPETVRAKRRED